MEGRGQLDKRLSLLSAQIEVVIKTDKTRNRYTVEARQGKVKTVNHWNYIQKEKHQYPQTDECIESTCLAFNLPKFQGNHQ